MPDDLLVPITHDVDSLALVHPALAGLCFQPAAKLTILLGDVIRTRAHQVLFRLWRRFQLHLVQQFLLFRPRLAVHGCQHIQQQLLLLAAGAVELNPAGGWVGIRGACVPMRPVPVRQMLNSKC